MLAQEVPRMMLRFELGLKAAAPKEKMSLEEVVVKVPVMWLPELLPKYSLPSLLLHAFSLRKDLKPPYSRPMFECDGRPVIQKYESGPESIGIPTLKLKERSCYFAPGTPGGPVLYTPDENRSIVGVVSTAQAGRLAFCMLDKAAQTAFNKLDNFEWSQ
ncbi:hypothetical protein BCR37DRAFT_224218 [Protomyces lactucae-debilis]|uniref:Uncharacterized protein n=1 Tax=Protomyces lactucae-debilis TaxID=2754530 RepID=A0A1Y2ES11_PROLT|nr:uncharacterized protein BCR37DRAFT_224218 [Protomyces lactucae-debilis]ORY74380.1 hypothetical protein BCR37DRAFT_224218 [Protomyces lactucae-debilis]